MEHNQFKKPIEDLKSLQSPENKREIMRTLACLGFYQMYAKNLRVDCKPFYDLTRSKTKPAWAPEQENFFNDFKNRITEDITLAILDTK